MLIDDLARLMDAFRPAADHPTHLMVGPGFDLRRLDGLFPNGEIAGMKVIVSNQIEPGTCWLMWPQPPLAPSKLVDWLKYAAIRPENMVKTTDVV